MDTVAVVKTRDTKFIGRQNVVAVVLLLVVLM